MRKTQLEIKGKSVLITGVAGFIGAALAKRIADDFSNVKIIGIDSMNDYYDVSLKEYRLSQIKSAVKDGRDGIEWHFIKGNIADEYFVKEVFQEYEPEIVVNLAAQAGVRYSIDNPKAYIESNIIGFFNILEACRHSYDNGIGLDHLVYASSSSIYGANEKIPYSTNDKADTPVSLYAATKRSNELMAYSYSKLYNIPSTGLRFFTVYGPLGRPDMAYFKFTSKLKRNEKIEIYNHGKCERDFTYIDDIVEGIVRVMQGAPEKVNGHDGLTYPPYALYNIGSGHPVNLMEFVKVLSDELVNECVLPCNYDFESHIKMVPMQPGDVAVTYADTVALERDYGYKPDTDLHDGIKKFVEWYKEYDCIF